MNTCQTLIYQVKKKSDFIESMKSMVRVQLKGKNETLKILSEVFTDDNISIFFDDTNKYYFMKGNKISDVIDDENNIPINISKISDIINNINIIGNFVLKKYQPINFENIYYNDTCYSFHKETLCLDYKSFDEKSLEYEKELIRKIHNILPDDEILQNILKVIYVYNLDWVNLYRILELIESSGINLIDAGWISKSDYRNFKHTANCPEITKLESRHGKGNQEPPKKPMSIFSARYLIIQLVMKYIFEKANGT